MSMKKSKQMIRKFFLLSLLVFICNLSFSGTNPEQSLTTKLKNTTNEFNGNVGIYVRHLKTGETVEISADSLFPTASMIKVPIMLKIFDMIDHGIMNYDDELVWYADSIAYPYAGSILYSFQEGKSISLKIVVSLMMSYSDNHASLWCQKLAGGSQINRWLENNGFKNTRVNSRTEGRQNDWKKYGWGQTTPREMAEMLVLIREGKAVSPAASEEMYRVLTRPYWHDVALSQIPPYIQVACKNGAVGDSRSEVLLVNAPSGDYVFCIITKNQQDTSWNHDNEGYALILNTSRLLWEHFEPDHPWSPAMDAEKYR